MKIAYVMAFWVVLSIEVSAAQFEHKGEKIKSAQSIDTTLCEGYKILIEIERFPIGHEGYIPKEFEIDNFYGSRSIVSMQAYLLTNDKYLIPNIDTFKGLTSNLNTGRTYLPYKAMCKGGDFVIRYWSGGNCKNCEFSVEFSLNQCRFKDPRVISQKDVYRKYQ